MPRLALFIIVAAWICSAIISWRSLSKSEWMLEGHISPFLRGDRSNEVYTARNWPVFSANSKFLQANFSQRKLMAENFLESHIKPLSKTYFTDDLSDWIIETAAFELSEFPVRQEIIAGETVHFRDYTGHLGVIIAPRLTYVLFSKATVLLTMTVLILGALFIGVFIGIYRWIYRGL